MGNVYKPCSIWFIEDSLQYIMLVVSLPLLIKTEESGMYEKEISKIH